MIVLRIFGYLLLLASGLLLVQGVWALVISRIIGREKPLGHGHGWSIRNTHPKSTPTTNRADSSAAIRLPDMHIAWTERNTRWSMASPT